MILGVRIGSNHFSQKNGVSNSTQAKLLNPSTGTIPGWDTSPNPPARFRAYTKEIPASSTIQFPNNDPCRANKTNGPATANRLHTFPE